MELYEKLQALRTARGLTQAELAETIGVSRQSVQKWESGATSPDIGKLPQLASLLGVSVDALLSHSIPREELLAASFQTSVLPAYQPVLGRRSVVDYLLLVPIGLGFALVVGMFYLFGAMFAGMGFVLSLFCLVSGVLAVPILVVNLPHGPGATLIGAAGIFLGLGLSAPVFYLSRWWWSVYRTWADRLTISLKKINFRSFL